jgi:threonine synthase
MERLRWMHPDWRALAREVTAHTVPDADIRRRIREDFRRTGACWCPHTAAAAEVLARLPEETRRGRHWVIVATAHPAKFNEIVEPLIGRPVPVPPALAELLDLPSHRIEVGADLDALRSALGAA